MVGGERPLLPEIFDTPIGAKSPIFNYSLVAPQPYHLAKKFANRKSTFQ